VSIRLAREEVLGVPLTSGYRRPVILLPRKADSWNKARITAVLWHELGHVRRGDNLCQLLALVICALHWFNPIFWFAARRMEAEAEIAADDFAILRGARPSSYAAELLAIAAELRSGAWKFPMAHAAMVKAFTIEDRLRSIIDAKSQRGKPPVRSYGFLAGAFLVLGIALILLAPRVAGSLEPRAEAAAPACLPGKTASF
jgi:beta-lactamase regulating signal transducer with metallopeptidase domain